MSSIIEEILGSGLKILLLGSYDDSTKQILYDLRKLLNENFQRYACTTILLENLDVHVARAVGMHDFSMFIEKHEQRITVTIMKSKTTPIEILTFSDEVDFETNIGNSSTNIDFKQFRKVTELEKISILSDWADLIYTTKDLELTRGGELVELTYLLHNRIWKSNVDPLKHEFFYKKDVKISTMVKEIISNNKIAPQEYASYQELEEKIIQTTDAQISRLNTQISRFNQFE